MPDHPCYLIVDDNLPGRQRLAQRLAVAWPQAEFLGLWHDGLSAREAIASQRPRTWLFWISACPALWPAAGPAPAGPGRRPTIVFCHRLSRTRAEAFGVAAVDYPMANR